MIDYIKPDPEGFIVVLCFLRKSVVRSDHKYIQSCIKKYKDDSFSIPIKSLHRNGPVVINKDIILLAVPHKQTAFRHYINLREIYKIRFFDNWVHITFYSGNHLDINVQSHSVYKRIKQLLMIVQDA